MSISVADWAEASAFVRGLGYTGNVLEDRNFQKQALDYLTLLLQKNQEVNLTGAKDLETAFWKHLVDSLTLLSLEPLGPFIDWGSGGGLPGIPVALARKHSGDSNSVHFVDSVGKKISAVVEFCEALELPNGHGHIGRGEELIRLGTLKGVRTVTMRAVAPAERAISWMTGSVPQWIFFLGPNQVEDWKKMRSRLQRMGLQIHQEEFFSLPRNLGERCLLRISKSST
jgi:16S rRNA G527 N7-methylase RsmG